MAETTEILNIQVDVKDAVGTINAYKASINNLKEKQKELRQSFKEGEISFEEYRKRVADCEVEIQGLGIVIKDTQKALKNQIAIQKANEGSLRSMRAELSSLTQAYDAMGKAERESAEGKAYQEKIANLSKEIGKLEGETNRFQRSVGNYENAIKNALGSTNPVISVLINLTSGVQGTGNAFKSAVTGVQAFGKALLSLLANPVVAVLAAIAATVLAISKVMKSSEEATNRWSVVLAPLNRMLSGLLNILQKGVGYILNFVEGTMSAVGAFTKWLEKFPLTEKAMKKLNEENREAIELEKEKIAITQQERKNLVQNAKDDLEIAKLRKASRDKENLTAQERLEALEKADKMEEERMKREEDLAIRKLEAARKEYGWTENNKVQNEELARLEAEVYNKQREYYEGTQRLAQQRQSVLAEIAAEEKAAKEERIKAIEEQRKAEEDAIRKAEDAMLALLDEGADKQRKILETNYKRSKKALEDEIKERRKNGQLTVQLREALNKQLEALEIQYQKNLKAISAEEIKTRIENQKQIIDLQLAAVEEGSLTEYNLRIAALENQKEAEIQAAEGNAGIIKLINEKYQKLQLDADQKFEEERIRIQNEALKKRLDAEKLQWENRITEAKIKGEDYQRVELEMLQAALNVQRMEGESADEFRARQLAAQQAYNEKKKSLDEAEIQMQQAKVQAMGNVFGAISSMLEMADENNLAALKMSKVLAVAEIAVQQGVAIANAVRAGSNATNVWQMIAQIATAITAVTASISSAIKSIRDAEKKIADAEAEKKKNSYTSTTVTVKGYSTGGLVPGSGTGDTQPAMLTPKESVMTAKTTSLFGPILSAFNQIGGGVPIQAQSPQGVMIKGSSNEGLDMLAEAFEKGARNIQVVADVKEISTVQNRINIRENINTLSTRKR